MLVRGVFDEVDALTDVGPHLTGDLLGRQPHQMAADVLKHGDPARGEAVVTSGFGTRWTRRYGDTLVTVLDRSVE